MKYVLIPDSFKGTLSSAEICAIAAEEIRALDSGAEICAIPVADGGEGTVDAFLAAVGGERVTLRCRGPHGRDVDGFYGMLPDGTAVVEMAAAAGLPLMGRQRNAETATTYGVGQLIAHALHSGAKRIVLGLGGSATNDGGTGAAAALGAAFLDADGRPFVPVGKTLSEIAHIRMDGLDPAVLQVPFVTMCDIDNPLCGENGASAVFGPQKGADAAMVARLDAGLAHLAEIVKRDLGAEIRDLPGSGAAGGFGGGSVAFFGSTLQMGIETVLDLADFDRHCAGADLVLTGEGRLDQQSLRGKTVIGVARRAKALGVPVAALVGAAVPELEEAYRQGVCGVFPIHPAPAELERVLPRSAAHLRFTVRNLVHFAQALRGRR